MVFALAVALNFGIRALDAQVANGASGLHRATDLIGTSVSGTFLYLIAAAQSGRAGRDRQGLPGRCSSGQYDDAELERQLDNRGLMNRFFGGYANRIDSPWKMYPVGVLFGLGFDTATEVALLVLAGTAVAGGLPFWAILSLPILFAAGMSLFDTIDGCFMNFAYDWAFAKPVRKVFYNLTITGLSVFVAFFIGTIELLGLLGHRAPDLHDPFFNFFAHFNINTAGFVIVGAFVATWVIAALYWHFGRRRGEVGLGDGGDRTGRHRRSGLTVRRRTAGTDRGDYRVARAGAMARHSSIGTSPRSAPSTWSTTWSAPASRCSTTLSTTTPSSPWTTRASASRSEPPLTRSSSWKP